MKPKKNWTAGIAVIKDRWLGNPAYVVVLKKGRQRTNIYTTNSDYPLSQAQKIVDCVNALGFADFQTARRAVLFLKLLGVHTVEEVDAAAFVLQHVVYGPHSYAEK